MAVAAPLTKADTGLLLIDVQVGIKHDAPGPSSAPNSDSNIEKLLAAFRADSGPAVMHVQHLDKDPQSALHTSKKSVQFEPFALPKRGEPIFPKTTSSAFSSSSIAEGLKGQKVRRLVVAGYVLDCCVSSTVRAAADSGVLGEGGEIILVDDATACYGWEGVDAPTLHKAHVASLKGGEFCKVASTEGVLKDLAAWA